MSVLIIAGICSVNNLLPQHRAFPITVLPCRTSTVPGHRRYSGRCFSAAVTAVGWMEEIERSCIGGEWTGAIAYRRKVGPEVRHDWFDASSGVEPARICRQQVTPDVVRIGLHSSELRQPLVASGLISLPPCRCCCYPGYGTCLTSWPKLQDYGAAPVTFLADRTGTLSNSVRGPSV